MKSLDTYLDLCTQVYELSKPKPPADAYEFYKSYAREAKGPILEPMCGTGRFLLPLLEEGFEVEGFDASEHMLKVLAEKAKTRGVSPKIWQDFAQDLQQSKTYNMIFIPSGSFGLIIDPDAAMAALKSFYEHLNEDGLLLIEGETLQAVPSLLGVWRGSTWPKPDGAMIMLNTLASLEGDLCTSVCKYELVEGNNIVRTEVEQIKVRLYDDPAAFVEMLKQVGFRDVRAVKAFDRTAVPGKDDEVIVYECWK